LMPHVNEKDYDFAQLTFITVCSEDLRPKY
jgi:hypothetical protein